MALGLVVNDKLCSLEATTSNQIRPLLVGYISCVHIFCKFQRAWKLVVFPYNAFTKFNFATKGLRKITWSFVSVTWIITISLDLRNMGKFKVVL